MYYLNITTGTTTTLVKKIDRDRFPRISTTPFSRITIANVDGHQADNVCLFIEDEAASTSTHASNNKFYFFKDVDIPYGASLEYNIPPFSAEIFHLRLVTQNASDGGTPSLSITLY